MATIKRIGIECETIEGKNPMWGVGRMIMKLLEEISRRKELEKDFRFILYFKDNIPDFDFLNAPIFEKKKVPVPFFRNRLFPIYYFALLPLKLRFERLDLMFWPNYMLPIIAPGKSLVMLTEDIYYEAHAGKLPFRYRLAYGIFGWWTARSASKIMAISETSKKNVSRLYKIKPDRIFVNYPGIDFKKNQESGNGKREIHSSYILFVGQMFPRRHAKETILAFEKIAPEFPELKFIIIGPDKYEVPTINRLVSQINQKLGREAIIHKDYAQNDDLVNLYSGASALVYVSEKEAFGLPPMEALSFGVPPVIAENDLGHELFNDYGFYVKGFGPDEIAKGVRNALTQREKIEKIKNEGPAFAKQYSWSRFADKWIRAVGSEHKST